MVGQLLATVREVIRLLLVKVGVLRLVLQGNLLVRLELVESWSSGWNLPHRVVRKIGVRVIEVVLAIVTILLCI